MFKLSVELEIPAIRLAGYAIEYTPTIVVYGSMEGKSKEIELFNYEFEDRRWIRSPDDSTLYLNNGLDVYDALLALYSEEKDQVTIDGINLKLKRNGITVPLFDPMDILTIHDTETDDVFNIPIKHDDIRMMANNYKHTLDSIFEATCAQKLPVSNIVRLLYHIRDGDSRGVTLTMMYEGLNGWDKAMIKDCLKEAMNEDYLTKKKARYFLTHRGEAAIQRSEELDKITVRQERV